MNKNILTPEEGHMKNATLREGLDGLSKFLFGSWKRVLFSVWLLISLSMHTLDKSLMIAALGYLIAGFSAVVFWNFREPIRRMVLNLRFDHGMKFVLVGSLGAVWVESIFWALGTIFGFQFAVHPNLLLNLLATMPWYVIMVFMLWKVEKKYSYSLYTILIFGGIYDFFADGISGLILGAGGVPPLAALIGGLLLLIVTFPVYVLAYSFMVLPPSYLLREEIDKLRAEPDRGTLTKYLYGLLPLAVFFIYFIIMFLISSGG